MGTLLSDLRNLKATILESFLQGLTPVECGNRLGSIGLYPPPTTEELREDSTFVETIKQVLIDEFHGNQQVKRLLSFGQALKTINKSSFPGFVEVFRANEKLLHWLPASSLRILKNKFGFRFRA